MKILMGLDQKMDWDFSFAVIALKQSLKIFSTSTKKSRSKYVEYAPYSKGNLFKIRYYPQGYYKVFYGTKEIAYCTSLNACIDLINKPIK